MLRTLIDKSFEYIKFEVAIVRDTGDVELVVIIEIVVGTIVGGSRCKISGAKCWVRRCWVTLVYGWCGCRLCEWRRLCRIKNVVVPVSVHVVGAVVFPLMLGERRRRRRKKGGWMGGTVVDFVFVQVVARVPVRVPKPALASRVRVRVRVVELGVRPGLRLEFMVRVNVPGK